MLVFGVLLEVAFIAIGVEEFILGGVFACHGGGDDALFVGFGCCSLYDGVWDSCETAECAWTYAVLVDEVEDVLLLGTWKGLELGGVGGARLLGDELPDLFVRVFGFLVYGLVIEESVFLVFGEGCLDNLTEVFERNALEYYICCTEGFGFLAKEFMPTAPWVFGYVLNEPWFEGILMDVAKECDEVMHVIAWL